eukprot:COSAG04_NODE_6527_length_1309_cov_25.861983_2_plen_104_part_00
MSSSDWLFGLWPGPPQRFEPTGRLDNVGAGTAYQNVGAGWPSWGDGAVIADSPSADDLAIGGVAGQGGCHQGKMYRGAHGEICGGDYNWGATDVEVWYPHSGH